jgi:hypothetical protein
MIFSCVKHPATRLANTIAGTNNNFLIFFSNLTGDAPAHTTHLGKSRIGHPAKAYLAL